MTFVDAVGYYDADTGTLRGTVVEADILTPRAQADTVALSRATWKSPEVRVRGAVSRGPDGLYASTVDLYTGASDGTNCTGVKLATTAVDSAADGDGAFEFRTRVTSNPQTVCVKSIGGGVDDIAVTIG